MSNTTLPRVPLPKPRSQLSLAGRVLLIAAALIAGAVLGLRTIVRPALDVAGEVAAKQAARR